MRAFHVLTCIVLLCLTASATVSKFYNTIGPDYDCPAAAVGTGVAEVPLLAVSTPFPQEDSIVPYAPFTLPPDTRGPPV
jgi:hypothetical protein